MIKALSIIVLVVSILLVAQIAAAAEGAGSTQPTAGEQAAANNFFCALNDFYLFGLSLVGISALFVIVWGGVQYATAGDSESRATRGRQRINAALWGILIAATSYALLYTINPDLVKFRIGDTSQTDCRRQ